ncbi:MAG: sigma 54-interacting transcriptional regulator [Bacillota bacterium]
MDQAQIKAFLDAAHEGVLAVNTDGRITIYNTAAERLIGIPADEVLGRYVKDVIPNTRLHVVLATGEAELDQVQEAGTTTLITNRVPVRDARGDIVGAVAVFRDIGEVKRLAEEIAGLTETRTLLEAIINSTQDAISVVDENGMGLLINPAYTRLTGMTEEDVLHKPATVDIAEGESMHLHVLRTRQPVKSVPMKVGPGRREVLVDAAPIIVDGVLKGSIGVIHDVSELRRLSEELDRTRQLLRHLGAKYTFEDIIAVSPVMKDAVEQAMRAAATPATVLLHGESGTGKELFAHSIHQAGDRSKRPFVRVNCAAIPETLLESELFGYVEGAFTGARRGGHKGYFAESDGGTIFLDEVSEINSAVQAKLLRVLQEKEIVPVGASRPVQVNVRVISATNSNLESMVKKGRFREDLYYRLNVVPIYIPSLRQRRDDIPHLANFLLRKINQEYGRNVKEISPEAMRVLASYHWPGNVRELENILGRALINMRPGDKAVRPDHILPLAPDTVEKAASGSGVIDQLGGGKSSLSEIHASWEKTLLRQLMDFTGGNRTRAAQLLKISVRQLYNKLKKYGLSE